MLIATTTKLYRLAKLDDPKPTPQPLLANESVQTIALAEHCALAALPQGRILVWQDGEGPTIAESGIAGKITSALFLGRDPTVALIGTEPPRLFRWQVSKGHATRIDSFDRLSCRKDWFTPWGGPPAVRSLARGGENWVYADIHVGSIMRSADAGENWQPVTPTLHQDVHQVTTTPASPERVYANTADAVWLSRDHGDTWGHRPFPHPVAYGRAIAVHPQNPACLLASVSEGPHGENVRGRLFQSLDDGRNWTHVSEGFPPFTSANIDTRHLVFDPCGTAWATVGNSLYRSLDCGRSWTLAWHAPNPIRMLCP